VTILILSQNQVQKCCPTNKNVAALTNALNAILLKYSIDSLDEVAAFLSQCGHESCDFNSLEENLFYSAKALYTTWPKRFPNDAICAAYARNPQKIANKVYADRMGNGNEASGDGWKFHGRGAIQLTGHDNYAAFAKASNRPIDSLMKYLITIEGAIDSACWFWTINGINALAEKEDVEGMTRKINGGTLGLDDRKARWGNCLAVLQQEL
jgi:putative chitinase